MITTRRYGMVVAAVGTAALLAGPLEPAAAADVDPDRVDAKTPLADYVPQVHEFPLSGAHRYSYTTSQRYWSVVGIEMNVLGDVDLLLYDDEKMDQLLKKSVYGWDVTDFVAVDSNVGRRPYGGYYPKVKTASGEGSYVIELAQGSETLSSTAQTLPVEARDVVVVRDTWLDAGTTYTFRVSPTAAVDPDVFLMESHSFPDSSWVQSRAENVDSAQTKPAGSYELFSYTPTESKWFGLVITLKGGDGSIKVHRYTRVGDAAAAQSAEPSKRLGALPSVG